MKVSCSSGFAPGDVVQRRWPSLVGDWKVHITGVFPLSDATDAILDCKNDLVLSQNAFSTKGSIIIQQIWRRNFQFCWSGMFIPDPESRIRMFPIPDPGYWIQIFSILDPRSQIWIFPFQVLDPGCISKNLSILTKKMVSQLLEIWSRFSIPDPDPGSGSWLFTYPRARSWIPDPESRDQKGNGSLIPDPGSGFGTLEISGWLRL